MPRRGNRPSARRGSEAPDSLPSVEWLPREFTGVRSPGEAQQDLLVIASAGEPLNRAHVTVDGDDGDAVRSTGRVTAEVDGSAPIKIRVDGVFSFEFDVQGCRGAWLSTVDGADYYGLSIDLGWGCVGLSDAYNGL
jgi:hypothetical protein